MPFDSVSDLLPGLLPAQLSGLDFHVPDTNIEAGRRVAEYLFPGIDRAAYDDHGLHPQDVRISGLLVGQDYISQARALKRIFETPGPKKLMHPWLGPMRVILVDPGSISFADNELYVARFSAHFKKLSARGASGSSIAGRSLSSTSQLLARAIGLRSISQRLMTTPARFVISAVRTAAIARAARLITSVWIGRRALNAQTARPLSRLETATADTFEGATTSFLNGVSSSVPVLTGTPVVTPSAEAETVATSTQLSVDEAYGLFLDVSQSLIEERGMSPSATDRVVTAGVLLNHISRVTELAAYVSPTSRDDAQRLSAEISSLLDSADEDLNLIDSVNFLPIVAESQRAIRDVRLALRTDINEQIGRLPATYIMPTDRITDAWAIAHHLYGDTPEQVESAYEDIVRRNKARHPAQLPAGGVEVLR